MFIFWLNLGFVWLPRMNKVAVVGGGMGGLATAARLGKMGWSVEVFDLRDGPGGKNYQHPQGDFRFDSGPSLLTMLEVFQELFEFCGGKMENYFTPIPLDPLCHYWFDDGSHISTPGTTEAFIHKFSQAGWASETELKNFFARCKKLHGIAGTIFLEKSLQEVSTFTSKEGLKSILGLPFIDAFRTLHQAHSRAFSDPRMVQLFDRYATYNGSDPYQAPATLDIIPWVESHGGGWGVKEGIHALAQGLYKLGLEMGVKYHFNTPVDRIVSSKGVVQGLVVQGLETSFDLVVSNADVITTYKLLGDEDAPWSKKYKTLEPSSSGFVYYWGMNKSFSNLGLHNIFFSQDYEKEFTQIFKEKIIPEDPTVYINITSKITPSDAPPGGENWFVLVNTPPHGQQNWKVLGEELKKSIIQRLKKTLGEDLESAIISEGTLSPEDIQNGTGSTFGSLYGLSSNSWNAAFNRHPNRSKRHKGLYFVGGSAHPGGGMPLVLLSARITSQLISKYEKLQKEC